MLSSKSLAARSALHINGLVLGMLEAARLLGNEGTKDSGLRKLDRLTQRLDELTTEPFLNQSLTAYLGVRFDAGVYGGILGQLRDGRIREVLPRIRRLAQETNSYLNESKRTEACFRGAT
jgi:hypothetical protein